MAQLVKNITSIKYFLKHHDIIDNEYNIKMQYHPNANSEFTSLPTFVAELVLRHFHVEKRLHVSAKQIATLFGQSFYCFNLEEICKKITDQCLHCSTQFYRNRRGKALGETRMFNDILTPNVCWSFDSMFLPPSQGYTHILLGVEAISSYIVLYPMRGTNVEEVIKCMHMHLTVFPHCRVVRTDHGLEFGSKFTEYLSTHSIFHLWSIPSRSQVNGQA